MSSPANIVTAMATAHAPQLFTYPPDEDRAQLEATIAAMRELGKLLDVTRPDVIIFLGSDHLETFSLTCVPTFAIVAGSSAHAEFAGRNYDLPIHREMAEELLNKLIQADFDIAYSEDALLGHTFAVPFEYVIAGRNVPVVPFHTNVYMPPLPSPKRCAALGEEIANIVAKRSERVAIIASGGMSHYPGTEKYPTPEFEFDHWLISELERGNADALLDMTSVQLDEVGNTELLNWATMFGAIGNRRGELLQYTQTWHHGHGVMRFLPERDEAVAIRAPREPYQFKNRGFEFYKHPRAEAYKLNKFLFDVRTDAEVRRRLLRDLEGVVQEFDFNALEQEALRAMVRVGELKKISDSVDPLVKVGAHPLQALMTLHVLHGEKKKLQREASVSGES